MLGYLMARKDALGALALRIIGTGLSFATTFVVARRFGPAGSGVYGLATQTALFLSTLGVVGLETSLVRHLAPAFRAGRKLRAGPILRIIGAVAVIAATLSGLLWLSRDWAHAAVFGGLLSPTLIGLVCVIAVGRSVGRVISALLRARFRFQQSQIVDVIISPLIVLLGLFAGWWSTVGSVLTATGATVLIAAGTGLVLLIPALTTRAGGHAARFKALATTSVSLLGTTLAIAFFNWYATSVAALHLGAADTGYWRLVSQVSALITVVSSSIFNVYAASIADAYSRRSSSDIAKGIRQAAILAGGIVLPVAAVLGVGAREALSLVRPEFAGATPALRIILIGQVFAAVTGPTGIALAVTDGERINFASALVTAALLVALAGWSVDHGGLTGLAILFSALVVLNNAVMFVAIRRKLVTMRADRHAEALT